MCVYFTIISLHTNMVNIEGHFKNDSYEILVGYAHFFFNNFLDHALDFYV